MRKVYLLSMMLGLIMFGLNNVDAQEVPWPDDLGEAMVIEPGVPGKINETIHGDTSATGERLHNHYILKRGQIYLYTARIQNTGYPLMVTAEEGDGDLPIIKAVGPAEGEDEAERIFHAEGDLYIKDLTLNGFDQGGNYTDNATVRMAADSITVVCKNVNFDFNRQNSIRINSVGCSLFVENCIIGNQGVAARLFQGFAVHFRGNFSPLVHMRNNTIYNQHSMVLTNRQLKRYNKLVFEHNTVMNTGTGGADFGRPNELVVKNNLFVNVGIMGDGFQGDRDEFVEPYYYFSIDSNFTDTTNTTLLDPIVDFTNNHFYLDPEVAALLPDSSDKSTETMIAPYLLSLIDETNIVSDEAFAFESFPATLNEYGAYINDFYNFAESPAEMPQFDTDFRTLDFGYSTDHAAYSAGSDGKPLGDLNWFPDIPNSIASLKNITFNMYPNPVQNYLKVELKEDQRVDKVVITNVLGQNVKTVESISGKNIHINTGELQTGLYFINFFNEGTLLGTNKVLKQ